MGPFHTKAARSLCAVVALGALAAPALASDDGRHSRHGRWTTPECDTSAGVLRIGGRVFVIDSGRRLYADIVNAFECSGYRAWVDDGCVRVRYGDCARPSISWSSRGYTATIAYDHGCATVTPCKPSRRGGPVHRGWDDRCEPTWRGGIVIRGGWDWRQDRRRDRRCDD